MSDVERGVDRRPPRMRPPPGLVSATALGILVATGYPWLVARALEALGTRGVALGLLALGALSLAGWWRWGRGARAPLVAQLALLALPAAAALGDRALFLRLVPAAIQFLIAVFFAASLRGGSSILERAAQTIHPYAPDFIGPYCRKATAAFAAIFAAQGAALAALALAAPALTLAEPGAGWASASGLLAWAPVMAATAVEWAIRKSWFRYYTDGPVDRWLRRLLPPERTAAGRRSLDYIRAKRLELGLPPP